MKNAETFRKGNLTKIHGDFRKISKKTLKSMGLLRAKLKLLWLAQQSINVHYFTF